MAMDAVRMKPFVMCRPCKGAESADTAAAIMDKARTIFRFIEWSSLNKSFLGQNMFGPKAIHTSVVAEVP